MSPATALDTVVADLRAYAEAVTMHGASDWSDAAILRDLPGVAVWRVSPDDDVALVVGGAGRGNALDRLAQRAVLAARVRGESVLVERGVYVSAVRGPDGVVACMSVDLTRAQRQNVFDFHAP